MKRTALDLSAEKTLQVDRASANPDTQIADQGRESFPWFRSAMMLALCGFGALFVRGSKRGARVAGLLAFAATLTYCLAVQTVADEETATGDKRIRFMDSYSAETPAAEADALAAGDTPAKEADAPLPVDTRGAQAGAPQVAIAEMREILERLDRSRGFWSSS